MALDSGRTQAYCPGMEATVVIPEGCVSYWHADCPGVDPVVVLARAADEAHRTGRPVAVGLPGGRVVTIHPQVAVAS